MSRIRAVKPEFFTSLTLARLPIPARLTFVGLWTYVDDEGRGKDDWRLIKAAIWPLDAKIARAAIEGWLTNLQAAGLIQRYTVDGEDFLSVTGFAEHQRVSHPTASPIPPPNSGMIREGSRAAPGGKERKGREGKGKELLERPSGRKRDLLFDALAEAEGSEPQELTRRAGRTIGVALAEIRAATPDVTPEEIRRRASLWPAHFPDATFTASALAKHWARLGHPAGARARRGGHTLDDMARQLAEEVSDAHAGGKSASDAVVLELPRTLDG